MGEKEQLDRLGHGIDFSEFYGFFMNYGPHLNRILKNPTKICQILSSELGVFF